MGDFRRHKLAKSKVIFYLLIFFLFHTAIKIKTVLHTSYGIYHIYISTASL